MGTNATVIIPFSDVAWQNRGWSGDGVSDTALGQTWNATMGGGEGAAAVTSLVGSRAGRDIPDPDHGPPPHDREMIGVALCGAHRHSGAAATRRRLAAGQALALQLATHRASPLTAGVSCPMRPHPRAPRRMATLAVVGGLAVAAITFSGCDYPAGPGSSATAGFDGCGDTRSLVRGCSAGIVVHDVHIYDEGGGLHPVASGALLTRKVDGKTVSLTLPGNAQPSSWMASLQWPTGDNKVVDPTSPVRLHIVSEPHGPFRDRWVLDTEVPTRAAADLPPAPVASLFPHDSPAARWSNPAIVDARQSAGTGLTYSWDTNGDGTYGDDPQGGWTDAARPPTGTAYLPQSAVAAPLALPVVKVTDSSGQSDTETVSLPTWNRGAGGLVVTAAGGQVSLTPDLGTLPTAPLHDVHYACIDVGDDGTFDTELPMGYSAPSGGFSPYLAPAWSGITRVRVAFFADDPTPGADRGSCTTRAPLALVLSTHTELVNGSTKAALEREAHLTARVKRYTGTARVRVTGGAVLSPGTQSGTSVRGVINRGRYSLRAPARGGGVARPAAIATFASGDFASRSNATLGFTKGGRMTIVGTTTMVIRGTGGALACITVAQTDSSTIWTVMGGTGAARTLRMVMNGGATLNSLITTAVPVTAEVTGTGTSATRALSPVTAKYRITASRGAGRGISSPCRALVTRLP